MYSLSSRNWLAGSSSTKSIGFATKSRNDGNATRGIDRPKRLHQCLADKVLTACGRSVDPMKPLDINVIVLRGLLGHKACVRFVGQAFADKLLLRASTCCWSFKSVVDAFFAKCR